jgi:hypothetical protein
VAGGGFTRFGLIGAVLRFLSSFLTSHLTSKAHSMAINVGQGTILTIATVVTTQVIEIDGPEATVGTKETTNLSSTVKTYRAQLPDGGTVSATIQYDPVAASHTALTTLINTWPAQPVACIITFNTVATTDKATFSAILTKFKPKGMNEEDNLEADIEFKVTGLVTWS